MNMIAPRADERVRRASVRTTGEPNQMEMGMSTTKKTAGTAATDKFGAAIAAGKENMENAVKMGTEAATKNYEQVVQSTREQVEAAFKAGAEAFKGYEQVADFNKGNVDAFMKSSAVLAKGIQDFNALWFDLARISMEESIAASKAMLGCKTLQQVVEVQTDLARNNYDRLVSETRKMSDMSVKVAEGTIKPLAGRVNEAVEKMTKPLAA